MWQRTPYGDVSELGAEDNEDARGGYAAAFRVGAQGGIVLGMLNLFSVLMTYVLFRANAEAIARFVRAYRLYSDCVTQAAQSGATTTICAEPRDGMQQLGGALTLISVVSLVVFLLTVACFVYVGYLAARESGRSRTGVGAALWALSTGWTLITIENVLAARFMALEMLYPLLSASMGLSRETFATVQFIQSTLSALVQLAGLVIVGVLAGLGGALFGAHHFAVVEERVLALQRRRERAAVPPGAHDPAARPRDEEFQAGGTSPHYVPGAGRPAKPLPGAPGAGRPGKPVPGARRPEPDPWSVPHPTDGDSWR